MPTVLERVPETPILGFRQRKELQEDREGLQSDLHNPTIQDKGRVRQGISRIDRQLATGSPPEVHPLERDDLKRAADSLLTEIQRGMNTQIEQRRNPPGAVDNLIRWEKKNKPKILRWKNMVRMLEPENPDQDLTNLERFRPPGDVVGLLANAQIPGVHAMSPLARDNWPLGPATATTAISHLTDGPPAEEAVNECKACGAPCGEKIYCNPECRDAFRSHKLHKKIKVKRAKAKFTKHQQAADAEQAKHEEAAG